MDPWIRVDPSGSVLSCCDPRRWKSPPGDTDDQRAATPEAVHQRPQSMIMSSDPRSDVPAQFNSKLSIFTDPTSDAPAQCYTIDGDGAVIEDVLPPQFRKNTT